MDLTSLAFWEQFHHRQGVSQGEWYFPYQKVSEFVHARMITEGLRPRLALHCGSGEYPAPASCGWGHDSQCVTVNFDYAASCLSTKGSEYEILIANAFCTPFTSNSFDIIVEKGLFDSVTSAGSAANAYALLSEYYRLLSKDRGLIFIFSIFGPNADQKDMMGLLCHEKIIVECKSLYMTPAELPDQDFCFVYTLRANCVDDALESHSVHT